MKVDDREVLLVRFADGPAKSDRMVNEEQQQFEWPLPERLAVLTVAGEVIGFFDAEAEHPSGGSALERVGQWTTDDGVNGLTVYRKVTESQLPDEAASEQHLARGATYEQEDASDQ